MSTRFHPDLRGARWIPRSAPSLRRLKLIRALFALRPAGRPKPEVHSLGATSIRVFRPSQGPSPVAGLLWAHPGGLVIGHAKGDDPWCRRVCEELGVMVVSVEYRVAPEAPYPAAIDDCYLALQWLGDQPGIARIAVGGASAGGGLAAGLALAARERGDVAVDFQLLRYPMLDDRTGRGGDGAGLVVWDGAWNRFAWDAYLRDVSGETPPLAAAARAADLAGLPPAWIGVGGADLFHAESVDYATRLRESGVEVELVDVPGAYHAFDMIHFRTQIAREFTESSMAALRRALT